MIRKIKFASIKTPHYVTLSVILKLYTALLLLTLFAVAGLGQNSGDSVFASNSAKPKTEDYTAANTALNEFLIGVMKQYPCVDTMSDSDAADLIGFER